MVKEGSPHEDHAADDEPYGQDRENTCRASQELGGVDLRRLGRVPHFHHQEQANHTDPNETESREESPHNGQEQVTTRHLFGILLILEHHISFRKNFSPRPTAGGLSKARSFTKTASSKVLRLNRNFCLSREKSYSNLIGHSSKVCPFCQGVW